VRLFVLARHAHTVLNLEQRVNGDPTVDVPLTPEGESQARQLGTLLTGLPLDACVTTRFGRTRRTAELALEGRPVPYLTEPLLDDIDVGDLEGEPIGEYRAWKRAHTRADRFPGGESLDEAAIRYVEGFRRLTEIPHDCVLVVCHEIPIRYAVNGARGSDELDAPVHEIPNATPFGFEDTVLLRAADRIGELLPAAKRGT
jgi:broad specificity phosphatase PhoE